MASKIRTLFLSLLALVVSGAVPLSSGLVSADDFAGGQWTAVKVTGSPRYSSDEHHWQTIAAGQAVPDGALVETPSGALVVLAAGGDEISVYANSQLKLPQKHGLVTSIMQYLGEALYHVKKAQGRHFEVETPYMIAGVKGTTFGVEVDSRAASVVLLEGRVLVTDRSNHAVDLMPGRYVTADKLKAGLDSGVTPRERQQRWMERDQQLHDAVSGLVTRDKRSGDDGRKASPSPAVSVRAIDLGAPVVGVDRLRLRTTVANRNGNAAGADETRSLGVVGAAAAVQTSLTNQTGLSVSSGPSTTMSVSAPSTTLTTSMPSTTLSTTVSSTTLSTTLPSTSLNLSLPGTSTTISAPSVTAPGSTTVTTSLPSTVTNTLSSTVSGTGAGSLLSTVPTLP